jgi:uncharacterized protein
MLPVVKHGIEKGYKMKEFKRKRELKYLHGFVSEKKSGLMYVRGRRRIGKSWLLTTFQKEIGHCFLFSGSGDSDTKSTIHHFAAEWHRFSNSEDLTRLRSPFLNWKVIFDDISRHIQTTNEMLTLIFDEVQWIAKEKSGFCGKLKEAWVTWQKSGKVKVIICGSSNRFFSRKTGGQEKILRGLQTTASLSVEPLSLREIRTLCCVGWKPTEVCLLYMMIGGIPYYLEQIDSSKGFIHAINDAIFINRSIFIEEIDELLNLDFNQSGKKTVKKVLSCLGQDGATQEKIIRATGLPSSTVSDILEKLKEYNILFEKFPAHTNPQRNGAGIRYHTKDFFLNFYFQVIHKMKTKIKRNEKGLLFPYEVLQSQTKFYIPNFSGKAFELLVRHVLETSKDFSETIFAKLLLRNSDYEILCYWNKQTEIDLIVEHRKDRLSRIIECKWGSPDTSWINELLGKIYNPPEHYHKKYVLISSETLTKPFMVKAKALDITLVSIEDLF